MESLVVKKWTHAFTLLAVVWSLFTVLALSDFISEARYAHLDENALPDLVIFALHGFFIYLAALFALREKATPTTVIGSNLTMRVAQHLFVLILLANIPAFALTRGGFWGQVVVHAALLMMGSLGLAWARRNRRREERFTIASAELPTEPSAAGMR
ncbi:MAG TPA: hypothetical protein VFW40_11030 [Capsulimonadaceae bacterium]|nr:hypothetical protein [Capsulimonadaceae bacterium]